MGIILRKNHGELRLTGIAKLSIVGFLISLSSSFVVTIWAVYLYGFLGNESAVGFISSFLTLIGIISYFVFIPLIEKSSKSKIFSYTLLVFGLSYILFYFTKNLYMFLIIASIITVAATLRVTSFGLIIKDKSRKSQLSVNESLLFTFANVAFIIGPLISGFVASIYGINSVFLLSAIFIFISFFMLKIEKITDNRRQKKTDTNAIKNFLAFFKDKDRCVAYIIGGGVSFWWILIYLYMPLLLLKNGLTPLHIGFFLFAIPIPLILLEYKLAKYAQKHGFKKLFKLGFLIPAVFSLIAFFFINQILVIIFLLVLASFGLAMLEPTSEAYFFDITKKREEQRFYGPYNTRLEIAGLFGKLIPAVLLLYFDFKYIFLLFSGSMFLLFFISHKVKNVIEKK